MTEVLSCSESSLQAGEPLAASASVADRWLLVEVRGAWGRDALTDSGLSSTVHAYLSGFPGKVILIRRPDRRRGVTVVHAIAGEAIGEAVRQELESLELLPDIDLSRGRARGRCGRARVCARASGRLLCAPRRAALRRAAAGYPARATLAGLASRWASIRSKCRRRAPGPPVRARSDRPCRGARPLDRRRPHPLDLYRGRTIYPQPVQAAELLVRTVTGHDGIADLRLVSHDPGRVTFSTPSGVLTAHVEERPGPTVPASCGATPEPTSGWAASLDL